MSQTIEAAPETEAVADRVSVTAAPRRSGLVLGALIGGGALVGGLLFGGGVILGANLPSGGGASVSGQFPGGPGEGGFPGGQLDTEQP